MSDDDRKELERLLHVYRFAVGDRHDLASANLIAFVDRLTNSQLREALDVAVTALELYAKWGKWSLVSDSDKENNFPKQTTAGTALDQIQTILKGDRLTEKGEK